MSLQQRFVWGFVLERAQQRVLRPDGSELWPDARCTARCCCSSSNQASCSTSDTLMRLLWPGLVVEENNQPRRSPGCVAPLGDDPGQPPHPDGAPTRLPFRRAGRSRPPPPPLRHRRRPALDALGGRARAGFRRQRSTSLARLGSRPPVPRADWPPLPGGLWPGRRADAAAEYGVTLAVLPFKPLVARRATNCSQVSMADSLIAGPSPGLVVRSDRLGAALCRRRPGPAARSARNSTLRGSSTARCKRRGEQLRVTARLLRRRRHRGVERTFDERFTQRLRPAGHDLQRVALVLGSPIAEIHAAGSGPLSGELGGTRNTDAYQLYLAATRHALLLRGDGLRKALDLYREALAIDPKYAPRGSAWRPTGAASSQSTPCRRRASEAAGRRRARCRSRRTWPRRW